MLAIFLKKNLQDLNNWWKYYRIILTSFIDLIWHEINILPQYATVIFSTFNQLISFPWKKEINEMSEWKNIQFCWRKKKKISLTERHMFSFSQCKFHMYIMLKREEKRERVCAFASLERQRKSFGGLPWLSDEDSELLLQGSQFWALVTEKIPRASQCGLKTTN